MRTKYHQSNEVKVDKLVNITDVELAEMLIVPEELVIMCAEQMVMMYGADTENTFNFVLKRGEELKFAGRTPVYLCTQDMKHVYVTSLESINKQYN